MNVALDHKPNCVVDLKIDLPADRVGQEWDTVSKEYQKQARLPGYRPGKAPKSLILSRYAKDIEEEVKDTLTRKAIREAADLHKLDLVSVTGTPTATIAEDKSMSIHAVIVRSPEFELPEYKNIAVEVARKTIGDSDVEEMLEYFREPHAKFDPVEGRALAMEDYAVMDYEGTVDGKPLTEVAPKAPAQLQGRRNAWVLVKDGVLVPGFAQAIEGMNPGDERTFTLEVPDTFPVPELHGKKVDYKATLTSINTRTMPPLDDALAEKIEPGTTLDSLRQKIRERLEESSKYQFDSAKRNAVIKKLLENFTCDLPEELVAEQTQTIIRDIVQQSQMRGASDEDLQSQTDEIFSSAEMGARDRVRANFLLLKIAEKENLKETESDIYQALYSVAEQRGESPKKVVKELSRSGGIYRIREDIRISKALDLVASGATVNEPAAPAEPANA